MADHSNKPAELPLPLFFDIPYAGNVTPQQIELIVDRLNRVIAYLKEKELSHGRN